MRLTRRYRFSASHRLHAASLTEEENRELYGKCNNPHGHGHDYLLEVTVEGPIDRAGQIADRQEFDALIRTRVLAYLDHKNLNQDLAEFASAVPTTENLASLVRNLLCAEWTLQPRLKTVRIAETDRNSFTLHV